MQIIFLKIIPYIQCTINSFGSPFTFVNGQKQNFYSFHFTKKTPEAYGSNVTHGVKNVQLGLAMLSWYVVGNNFKTTIFLLQLNSRNPWCFAELKHYHI
jgi:hypothetical protein